jgi:predicted RNase H-like HicB family nuclease
MRTKIEIFWSQEDDGWIAVDLLRPGCSAFGISENDALRELHDARKAWDGARAALPNGDGA